MVIWGLWLGEQAQFCQSHQKNEEERGGLSKASSAMGRADLTQISRGRGGLTQISRGRAALTQICMGGGGGVV